MIKSGFVTQIICQKNDDHKPSIQTQLHLHNAHTQHYTSTQESITCTRYSNETIKLQSPHKEHGRIHETLVTRASVEWGRARAVMQVK